MKKRDYIGVVATPVIVMCASTWLHSQSRGFEMLCSVEMALSRGGCQGCDTTTCSSGPCYEKDESGYYMKEGTGNTVAICSSQRAGGCNFEFEGNEYVPCHLIKVGCSNDTCTSGCSTTRDYGYAECRPL